jgi:hypothetical protein
MKKYKTWEVIKMLTENPKQKFKNDEQYEMSVCDDNGCMYLEYKGKQSLGGVNGNLRIVTNEVGWKPDEWELIQQPVTFMEAVKAYSEGKTIRCKLHGGHITYEPKTPRYELMDISGHAITIEEVMSNQWYVEE